MQHSPLKDIEQQLDETSQISTEFINIKIRNFCIRWTLTIILYIILWNKISWIKWTLLLTIPLGLFALWQILSTKFRLSKKVDEIRQTINHIEAMEQK